MSEIVTAQQVIKKRQAELIDEAQELRRELQALEARKQEIYRRLTEIEIEYSIHESYDDQGRIETVTTVTQTTTTTRRAQHDRLNIEDIVKNIMLSAGRPIQIGEIIDQLERFGYIWSRRTSAYEYLKRLDILMPAGKHGFYQLRR
mgnify:CR=1 FL=1